MFEMSIKNLKKKKLSLSIVYSKCGHEYGSILKEEASTEILKIIGLINNIKEYQKYIIMSEENISREFRLKNLDETRIYLIEEINQNELMSKKNKKVCATLNYIEHFIVLGSTITRCVFVSVFHSLLGISTGIASSATGLKICAIIAGYKKYKSIKKK